MRTMTSRGYHPRFLLPLICLMFPCIAIAVDQVSAPVKNTGSPATYLAKVNGVTIPVAAFEQALSEARAAGQTDSTLLRTLLTQRLVAEEIFWQEAQKLSLHKSKESTAAAEAARRQAAIGQYLARTVKPAEPDEAALRQQYERIVANLGAREYRISVIQTADEAALQESAHRLADGADFANEARRVSQIPSAANGGAVNWLSFPVPPVAGRTNGLPLPLAEAILKLKPGVVSAPILLPENDWALIRLDEERATQIPDYASTRDTLKNAAQIQAAATDGRELAERLIGAARIEINPAFGSLEGEMP